MNRRRFIKNSMLGAATASGNLLVGCKPARMTSGKEASEPWRMYKNTGPTLFPLSVPSKQWVQFTAAGFSEPVCGLVYRKDNLVECGVPMGGIDTGCLDVDTDGTLGYCSMFGSLAPPRGPVAQPFLGISVGKQTWILALHDRRTHQLEKVDNATEIHYWGHYPVADLEYETSAPVNVGLRAWTPFIPGDVAASNTPGAVFEVRLRNSAHSRQRGIVTFSFPGPTQGEAQIRRGSRWQKVRYNYSVALEPVPETSITPIRRPLSGELSGIAVISPEGVSYALAAIGGERVRPGTHLGSEGILWALSPDSPFRQPAPNDLGASLAVDFDLGSQEIKTVRFVLSWYAPLWKAEGDHYFTHMYAQRYRNSVTVARLLAREHTSLLRRILGWQQAIYGYDKLPVWLRESLVNNLYMIAEDGLWATAKPPIGGWCRGEDGLFGMSESPRECPQMECIPCSFYGNIPLVYFFPELALSTLRGYKGYHYSDGAAPWIFGGITDNPPVEGTEMAMPTRGYQTTTNGISYADMVDKYWLRTGSDDFAGVLSLSEKKHDLYDEPKHGSGWCHQHARQ